MGQDYTGALRLRGKATDVSALLQFQQAHGLRFAASDTCWRVHDDSIFLVRAPQVGSAGLAADSRHADFTGDGFALGLGFLDHEGERFALLTITERALVDFVDALVERGADMLSYLASLADALDAEAFALGLNVDAIALLAFLRGVGAEGVCVASGVPPASEAAMRSQARVLETTVNNRRLLHSWLPGHDAYFR
jgi:hypothetical protein